LVASAWTAYGSQMKWIIIILIVLLVLGAISFMRGRGSRL
jgi:hypothetical protein